MNPHHAQWLAAYLYYAEPWENFLSQAVKPFVEKVMRHAQAQQYFFIRYWEKGPHIRLRFKGNAAILSEQVKPALTAHFTHYFQQCPSQRTEPVWLQQAPEDQQWYPDNSAQFIPYEPETERYGGTACMPIAEQQFQASSQAVLTAIDQSQSWDYNRALGAGIQMHLGFAYQLGMGREEACTFFSHVFHQWLPRAYYHFGEQLSEKALQQRKEEVLQAFAATYARQKHHLLALFQSLWEGLGQPSAFASTWFRQWLTDMSCITQQLMEVQADGKLIPPAHYRMDKSLPYTAEQQARWTLYESYVHMTNNRLGILNRDEGFLAYIIMKGLQESLGL